jgi:hypothetical protein
MGNPEKLATLGTKKTQAKDKENKKQQHNICWTSTLQMRISRPVFFFLYIIIMIALFCAFIVLSKRGT